MSSTVAEHGAEIEPASPLNSSIMSDGRLSSEGRTVGSAVGWQGQQSYRPVVLDSLHAPALAEADFSVVIMASETAQQRSTLETEILGAW